MQQNNVNAKNATKKQTSLKKVTKHLHKNIRKVNNNNNNKNKKKAKKAPTTKHWYSLNPTHFSQALFTSSLPVFISKICFLNTIHLHYGIMLFIMTHFIVKAIFFIELVKAIYFLSFLLLAFPLWDYLNLWTFFLRTYTYIT